MKCMHVVALFSTAEIMEIVLIASLQAPDEATATNQHLLCASDLSDMRKSFVGNDQVDTKQ